MELTRTWIDDAGADGVRVCGEVTYDDRPGHPETYWFDFPRECPACGTKLARETTPEEVA